ncbi:serine/threonine protein kinase [Ideonella alba]|uniref:HDOD domain-containing protein n=1 Tax=Ideonella alba TaxID=2824118 RepID=A0A940YND6_9BURK|nr:HDOD domain-containing protein [Ideonella alba]MBQ0932909.1 HDOD domain-containing protein [Ideonella alba]
MSAPARSDDAPKAPTAPVRRFGRYQLLRLLGKSERTMAWHAADERQGTEWMLVMPRQQPQGEAAAAWMQSVRRAARLNHPNLATPVEIAEHERWPYVAYERHGQVTWAERFSRQGIPAEEMAPWASQAALGLAYAHEAGVAHHDVQPWLLSVDDGGRVQVLGLEVPQRSGGAAVVGAMEELRQVRDAAVGDVLALGIVMHHGLAGQPALDQTDVARVVAMMPPLGNDFVRLPWNVPRPIPDALRAIVNRATDRQPRQRYRNARTLQRALDGWIKANAELEGGPLALLLDRIRAAGVLPAMPGGADRVAHLALMERGRTSELAEVVLGDMALAFELLRLVNGATVQGHAVSSDGPVLMLRRAIAMLGLEGVRRAALSLRPWPGPMDEAAATEMAALMRRVQRAGGVATRLAPAGYDGEVISLIAQMQNLGRLVVQYHFPDEAAQIRRLMQPGESADGKAGAEPGMSAEAASYAVLGIDLEALGLAVAQHWGLDDSVQQMIRRIPPGAPVHHPDIDADILRVTASCANDLLDASALAPKLVGPALAVVVRRYARALGLTQPEMLGALQALPSTVDTGPAMAGVADASAATRAFAQASASAGASRAAAA